MSVIDFTVLLNIDIHNNYYLHILQGCDLRTFDFESITSKTFRSQPKTEIYFMYSHYAEGELNCRHTVPETMNNNLIYFIVKLSLILEYEFQSPPFSLFPRSSPHAIPSTSPHFPSRLTPHFSHRSSPLLNCFNFTTAHGKISYLVLQPTLTRGLWKSEIGRQAGKQETYSETNMQAERETKGERCKCGKVKTRRIITWRVL